MLRRIGTLMGSVIDATDGELGRVDDVYLDDERWTVRYLVVDTGHWLAHRRVLISPISVREHDWGHHRLRVALTMAQVRQSPKIDTAAPVGRRHEAAVHEHYGFPYYWLGDALWGIAEAPASVRAAQPRRRERAAATRLVSPGGADSHLRGARALRSYHVQALDDEIGHVDDFLVDDETWAVRYLVVDTRDWWPGRRVLVAPEWVVWMSRMELRVHVALHRETLRRAPEYDPSRPMAPAYEARLDAYYGRPAASARVPAGVAGGAR